jgi:hypothetical protein
MKRRLGIAAGEGIAEKPEIPLRFQHAQHRRVDLCFTDSSGCHQARQLG